LVFDYPTPVKLAIMKVFIVAYYAYKVLWQNQLRRRLMRLIWLRNELGRRRTDNLVWRRTKLVGRRNKLCRRRTELVGWRTELVGRRNELHRRSTELVGRRKETHIHWLHHGHHGNLRLLWVHNYGYLCFVLIIFFRLRYIG
jgi:hypothetical protein